MVEHSYVKTKQLTQIKSNFEIYSSFKNKTIARLFSVYISLEITPGTKDWMDRDVFVENQTDSQTVSRPWMYA